MSCEVINNVSTSNIDIAYIKQITGITLSYLSIGRENELSIAIDNNKAIRELNLKYRNIDEATDVLAFPANEINPETGIQYIGDIIISYEQAEIQAKEKGHELIHEIALLTVHGILHLLGYDHDKEKNKANMWRIQNDILTKLQITG